MKRKREFRRTHAISTLRFMLLKAEKYVILHFGPSYIHSSFKKNTILKFRVAISLVQSTIPIVVFDLLLGVQTKWRSKKKE